MIRYDIPNRCTITEAIEILSKHEPDSIIYIRESECGHDGNSYQIAIISNKDYKNKEEKLEEYFKEKSEYYKKCKKL